MLALIKSYVWFKTIHKKSLSIGQSLLQLKYYDLSQKHRIENNLNFTQKYSFLFSEILFPYIRQRLDFVTNKEKTKNIIEIIENVYKTLDLINSLIFLYYGKYRSLWERLFRIGIGLESPKQMANSSELYFEIMTRELLWNSFAEFLTFVLPLINFFRLKNTFNNFLRTFIYRSSNKIGSDVEQRDSSDLKICQICNQWPIDGHEIGCRHVFCYYCLMSNFLSDQTNGFTCDQCFHKINSIECIKRVKISVLK